NTNFLETLTVLSQYLCLAAILAQQVLYFERAPRARQRAQMALHLIALVPLALPALQMEPQPPRKKMEPLGFRSAPAPQADQPEVEGPAFDWAQAQALRSPASHRRLSPDPRYDQHCCRYRPDPACRQKTG